MKIFSADVRFKEGIGTMQNILNRSALFLFVLAFTLLAPQGVKGYNVMDNDRILLMNNDSKFLSEVTCQGYYDTNKTQKTYWVHDKTAAYFLAAYALPGTNHVMYTRNGRKLWELVDCRAGSGTLVANATRNYIPWSTTAKSILTGTSPVAVDSTGAKGVGSVVFRNSDKACLYSPYYDEGIGTIYFDAVNAFASAITGEIALEIATNVTQSAREAGVLFNDDTAYGDCDWQACPMDVLTVVGKSAPTIQETGATTVTLASTATRDGMFYRLRAHLNWYNPIRFRIRRLNQTGGQVDSSALILLDNIIASYPPMTAEIRCYGEFDDSLKGADVLGYGGDFENAFLANGGESGKPRVGVDFVTNTASSTDVKILNLDIHYRWRYLNQQVGPWKTVPFNVTGLISSAGPASNVWGRAGVSLTDGPGDLEYYFVANIDAPYFNVRDYACSAGYGAGWTEAITAVTNRASYTAEDALPSGGTDYFVRIREGESDYEWVKLVSLVSTNATNIGTNGPLFGATRETRMELVGDHTWRTHYYVPTNMVGETLRFHFQGKEYYKADAADLSYATRTNTWFSDLSAGLPYVPYTSVVRSDFTLDASTVLDGAGTHLLIEFNDELLSFSVSHATYQNFNMWTDAMVGFRGNATYNEENPTNGAAATGVSDAKKTYDAEMGKWETSQFHRDAWREGFNFVDTASTEYPYDEHIVTGETPNGWGVENGAYVPGQRGIEYNEDGWAQKSLAWQMDGYGKGSISLKKSSVPGVGEVRFTARVSQEPSFDGFSTYLDGTRCANYAISAKLTMSRRTYNNTEKLNPLDISPTHPSVSLVGYYRASKGCYELRFTRVDDQNLSAELYKWTQVAGEMTPTRLATKNLAYSSFANLLVPQNGENATTQWTSALLSLYTKDGQVLIDGWLSSKRNTTAVGDDTANLQHVIAFTDTAPGALVQGTYGVGSCDCSASFGALRKHNFVDDLYNSANALCNVSKTGEVQTSYIADDWDLMETRWRQLAPGESSVWLTTGLAAVIPSNQTVEVLLAKASSGGSDAWLPCDASIPVASFSTNTVVVKVNGTAESFVQLRTGMGDASVTVDNIEVSSWAAKDRGSEDHYFSKEWTFSRSVVEASAEVTGGNVDVQPAGTNGYCYIFSGTGRTIEFTPTADMIVDRVLVVGGGGSGGATMGGGGGGGGVVEYNWTTNGSPVTVPAGTTIRVVVGAGAKAVKPTGSGGGHAGQPGGTKGGDSSVVGMPGMPATTAYGGGGGGGWGEAGQGSGNVGSGGAKSGNANAGTGGGKYTAAQGNAGGDGVNSNSPNGSQGGGGGGAGGPGATAVKPTSGDPWGGRGGDGVMSDITGEDLWYGGGGGGGAGWHNTARGGAGGRQGDGSGDWGHGSDRQYTTGYKAVKGRDGFGGGGGGGTFVSNSTTEQNILGMGADGGNGTVIFRVRTAAKICTLQPARGVLSGVSVEDPAGEVEPMGVRSPFLDDGLSLVSLSYVNAHSNCVLWLQVCTNITDAGSVGGLTRQSPEYDDGSWQTVAIWAFPGARAAYPVASPAASRGGVTTNLMGAADLKNGTLSYYQSFRSPAKGLMRVIVDPAVVREGVARARTDEPYGQITLTKAYCYNEPRLDDRSWWGWNLHTEGWNTADKSYAYLVDSPNGLSCMLNFSALEADNTHKEANGIGLGEANVAEYAKNNPFVQCPPLTNGIGTVTFRARAFTNGQTRSSWVTLYGSHAPDMYQIDYPDMWLKDGLPLAEFEITNTTFQTFTWKTTDDNDPPTAIRLEVTAARKGRYGTGYDPAWEKPQTTPIQRVLLDEISVSEAIVPRLVFRDVRPFRSRQLREDALVAVSNVTSASEQPITGESWGIQATVEPQQMSDELDTDSLRVFATFHKGEIPWGYATWAGTERVVELPRMGSNLVFRSHMRRPESIQAPLEAYSTVQYMVWAEFKDRAGVVHTNMLDASQWTPPSWYSGLADLNVKYGNGLGERFSGYTIFDSISPKRAWVNEVNYRDADSNDLVDQRNQYIEFAVPQNADLTGWYLRITGSEVYSNRVLAVFGRGNATKTVKLGSAPGVDCTNSYTFMTLRSPLTTNVATVAAADGVWDLVRDTSAHIDANGVLRGYEPYGVALVRPSGVIEHELVVEGRNPRIGGFIEYLYSGTNMTEEILRKQPGSPWFFAGRDEAEGSLGVFRSHGEDITCWTNRMIQTPGKLNRTRENVAQDIDPDWFLRPNGTNVWIYAYVNSPHISQEIAGVTNSSVTVMVIGKGDSTNIVYNVDRWYEIGSLTTNAEGQAAVEVAGARGRGGAKDIPAHRYTLRLDNVQESMTVNAGDQASQIVVDAGLPRTDPYFPAVMDWLHRKFGDAEDDTIHQAEFHSLDNVKRGTLGIKDMYWLDIPPNEAGWWLKGGMGAGVPDGSNPGCMPKGYVYTNWVDGVAQEIPSTNIVVTLTLMITNHLTDVWRKPSYLQGLEPGSSSSNYTQYAANNWTSCTFKVTGALQKPGVTDTYMPLRWFVFGPDSFDDNCQARIEVTDPFLPQSVGGNYGWPAFRNVHQIFYRWRLDGNGPGTASAEPLKADSTY